MSLGRYHLFRPRSLTLPWTAEKTVLKLSKFGARRSPRQPHPADKWIGNKLPYTRDGSLILINRDVKKRWPLRDGVNSLTGNARETTQPRPPSLPETFSTLFPLSPLVELGWRRRGRPLELNDLVSLRFNGEIRCSANNGRSAPGVKDNGWGVSGSHFQRL